MEHNSRYYCLALKIDNYPRSRSLKAPLAPLPYHIQEEEDSQGNMMDPKPDNIFGEIKKTTFLQGCPSLSTPYQYVGMKEMKSYLSKGQKKRRHNNTMFKRTTESNLSCISLSRISQIKVPPERYLNKDEVLNIFTHNPQQLSQGSSFVEETFLNNQTILLHKTISPNTSSLGTTIGTKTEKDQQRGYSHDFSLKKVINKMKRYQRGWEKQAWEKEYRGLRKRAPKNKITSIIKNTEQYRSKVEELEQNSVAQQLENIQPKLWDRALRTSKTMVNLCEKDLQKIVKTDLVSTGRCKLTKQIEWVQEKDRQGMVFRLPNSQKASPK